MDTNRDSAHQSRNEDNFVTFSLGLEFLNEAEKEKNNEKGDSASAPSRFASQSGEMQQSLLIFASDLMHNSTDYVIKQLVHALACTIELWSTWEVWRTLKKLELPSAIASGNSYASFLLSKLPVCSITRYCTLKHEPIVNLPFFSFVVFLQQALSNVHSVRATATDKDPLTWNFNPKVFTLLTLYREILVIRPQ